jgi:hypothetical protein
LVFDEANSLVRVERGYNGTTASTWKKGSPIRIFRVMNEAGQVETTLEDVTQEDGTVLKDQLVDTKLVYDWTAGSTCLPGCYWLEFKLLKMEVNELTVSLTPSFTSSSMTAETFGCVLGDGVEWVRRFPVDSEAFLVKIVESPSAELV